VHDLHDPFAPIQGQQDLRPLGYPLEDLPILGDLLQLPTIHCFQGVRERVPSSHPLLFLYEPVRYEAARGKAICCIISATVH
jgi:hypothetical protein